MSMFSTGLLVLTSPLHTLPLRIAPVLSSAAQVVERTLYVHLHPGLNLAGGGVATTTPTPPLPVFVPPAVDVASLITRLYSNAADVCAHLDVRVLLTNVRAPPGGPGGALVSSAGPFPTPQPLSHPPDVVLTDFPVPGQGQDPGQNQASLAAQCLQKYAGRCYVCSPALAAVMLHPPRLHGEELQEEGPEGGGGGGGGGGELSSEPLQTYGDVVVGGTFDRLHGAHKTLLNICCLLADQRFLIGVCDQELLKKKVLRELIQPYALRVQRLRDFLADVKPALRCEIVPLADPFGPSVVDARLQCIVVSEETRRGGEAVNRKRLENGLPALVLHEIQVLKDAHHSEAEEEKISSSSLRSRVLGTLLRAPTAPPLPLRPYVIGLTGGSGSGKSSVARRLEALGAARVDADLLGHATYRPGAAAHRRVTREFGSDILNEDKTINRRALGRKVFGNKERLKALTDIVWPEIALLVKEGIQQAREEGKQVCVVDAAVLLEAGWSDFVHEVWVTVIPEDEAVRRITERDGVSPEDAARRLQSQWSSERQVEQASVVLCTLWEPAVTQRQVQKAWDLLQKRILQRLEEDNPS